MIRMIIYDLGRLICDLGRLMDEVYRPETVEAILDFTYRITKAISGSAISGNTYRITVLPFLFLFLLLPS
jgi:hypothetical protein